MRRRWIVRFVWLSAWTSWAMFGYALYRALPRTVGEPVSSLGLENKEQVLGYLESERLFVTTGAAEEGKEIARYWDPSSGRVVRTLPTGRSAAASDAACQISSGVARMFVDEDTGPDEPFPTGVLDLLTGRTAFIKDLDSEGMAEAEFHSHQPWLLLTGHLKSDVPESRKDLPPSRILIYDATTGMRLCCLPPAGAPSSSASDYSNPRFLPDTNCLLVRHDIESEGDAPHRRRLEVWRIPFGDRSEREFDDPRVGWGMTASANERIAWRELGVLPPTVDVFDLKTGKFLLSDPPKARRNPPPGGGTSGSWPGISLSRDGAFVLEELDSKVVEVATGRKLLPDEARWQRGSRDYERGLNELHYSWQEFAFIRLWNWAAEKAFPALKVEGGFHSVFELGTGRFLYNCDESELSRVGGGEWRLDSEYDSRIWHFPPHIRWGWILGAQCVLAAPLVAVDFWFRLRRKRMQRAAG